MMITGRRPGDLDAVQLLLLVRHFVGRRLLVGRHLFLVPEQLGRLFDGGRPSSAAARSFALLAEVKWMIKKLLTVEVEKVGTAAFLSVALRTLPLSPRSPAGDFRPAPTCCGCNHPFYPQIKKRNATTTTHSLAQPIHLIRNSTWV